MSKTGVRLGICLGGVENGKMIYCDNEIYYALVDGDNNAEVFDEQYIEWFKNSAYYDEKNTTIIPVKFSLRNT